MRRSVRNEKNIAQLLIEVSKLREQFAELRALVDDTRSFADTCKSQVDTLAEEHEEFKKLLNEQTEDIAFRLSQRWESALAAVADYDPFSNIGKRS